MEDINKKYVAFCDILGFSNSVTTEYENLIKIYKDFREEINKYKDLLNVRISIYSDSIIIIGDDLLKIASSIQILLWITLRYDWIVRGGIAYGKHWEESDKNNLYIVSEALVKAVNIEKTIKSPTICISPEIDLGLEYWMNGFENPIFNLPIIHYKSLNIVNPFNNYWFKSAEIKLTGLKAKYKEHSCKYEYLLNLIDDIKANKLFAPQSIIDYLIENKILQKIESTSNNEQIDSST